MKHLLFTRFLKNVKYLLKNSRTLLFFFFLFFDLDIAVNEIHMVNYAMAVDVTVYYNYLHILKITSYNTVYLSINCIYPIWLLKLFFR